MAKAVQRATIELNAAGRAVGRVATEAAMILQGKHKADYERYLGTGDNVVIKNAAQVIFTGRKLEQKDYRTHTMHPGGLKEVSMKRVFTNDPTDVVRRAVYGMLPKNRQRDELMKRLKIEA